MKKRKEEKERRSHTIFHFRSLVSDKKVMVERRNDGDAEFPLQMYAQLLLTLQSALKISSLRSRTLIVRPAILISRRLADDARLLRNNNSVRRYSPLDNGHCNQQRAVNLNGSAIYGEKRLSGEI